VNIVALFEVNFRVDDVVCLRFGRKAGLAGLTVRPPSVDMILA